MGLLCLCYRQWEQLQHISMFNPLMPPNPAALFPAGVPLTAGPPPRMPLIDSMNNLGLQNPEKITPTSLSRSNQPMSLHIPTSKVRFCEILCTR